jgi:hypothetical protein
VVEFEPQTPIDVPAALGIDHAHPLLRDVACLYSAERAQGLKIS